MSQRAHRRQLTETGSIVWRTHIAYSGHFAYIRYIRQRAVEKTRASAPQHRRYRTQLAAARQPPPPPPCRSTAHGKTKQSTDKGAGRVVATANGGVGSGDSADPRVRRAHAAVSAPSRAFINH
uniref:Uncharacterized protein n=1 Tax=Plectus sambesii TaxID=2011161 RepID=A0A914XRA8_9BILA